MTPSLEYSPIWIRIWSVKRSSASLKTSLSNRWVIPRMVIFLFLQSRLIFRRNPCDELQHLSVGAGIGKSWNEQCFDIGQLKGTIESSCGCERASASLPDVLRHHHDGEDPIASIDLSSALAHVWRTHSNDSGRDLHTMMSTGSSFTYLGERYFLWRCVNRGQFHGSVSQSCPGGAWSVTTPDSSVGCGLRSSQCFARWLWNWSGIGMVQSK